MLGFRTTYTALSLLLFSWFWSSSQPPNSTCPSSLLSTHLWDSPRLCNCLQLPWLWCHYHFGLSCYLRCHCSLTLVKIWLWWPCVPWIYDLQPCSSANMCHSAVPTLHSNWMQCWTLGCLLTDLGIKGVQVQMLPTDVNVFHFYIRVLGAYCFLHKIWAVFCKVWVDATHKHFIIVCFMAT